VFCYFSGIKEQQALYTVACNIWTTCSLWYPCLFGSMFCLGRND